MSVTLDWKDIVLRLLCTLVAGTVLGIDRGEKGRAAGLRTTVLVSLAACVSMIQTNLLVSLHGKMADSFVVADVMRLPLGILTGVGFIGGGAILRRDNMILGVTTAATLWFVTVVGLCFGGGQIELGIAASLLGMLVLIGFRTVEKYLPKEHDILFKVILQETDVPHDNLIQNEIILGKYQINTWEVAYDHIEKTHEVSSRLRCRTRESKLEAPIFLETLRKLPVVRSLEWRPIG